MGPHKSPLEGLGFQRVLYVRDKRVPNVLCTCIQKTIQLYCDGSSPSYP